MTYLPLSTNEHKKHFKRCLQSGWTPAAADQIYLSLSANQPDPPQIPVVFMCIMSVQSRLSGMNWPTHHKYLQCLSAWWLYSHASVEWTDLPTTSTCSVCVHYVCTVTPQWSALDPTHMDTRIFIHQWHKNVHWNLSWCRYNHSENKQYTTATSVIKNNY